MTIGNDDRAPGAALAALPAHIRALTELEYPRFSQLEMTRRRAALAAVAGEAEVDAVLVCGENRAGTGVHWLTGWPITTEAVVVFTPGERDALFVQYHNHVPQARRIASDADVRWGEQSTIVVVAQELAWRGARRVGLIGSLQHGKHRRLAERFDLVDLGAAYVELRRIKSQEEIDWMRLGAALSDEAIAALRREVRVGIDERALANITERAYVAAGGTTVIHYFGTTSMAHPDCRVPRQFASARRLAAGDVVFAEISAAFWEYPGQVLRSFTVDAEPTPLYRELYAAADAAFDAIAAVLRDGTSMQAIVDAAGVIEDAGFTTCDDLVHGYGGGYFPPVLGSASRPAGPLPDIRLQEGMTIVVQPNVVTVDGNAGVQVGELVRVTAAGYERLHTAPREFFRVG